MDRRGHYVKPTVRLSIPAVAFAVECQPWHSRPAGPLGTTEATWRSADICRISRRKDKWRAPETCRVLTPEAMREWMQSRALKGAINWVIAPSVTDVLTISGWWDHASKIGIRISDRRRKGERGGADQVSGSSVDLTRFVASGAPDIIEYTHFGVRWRWVSAANYWPDGPDECGGAHALSEGRDGGPSGRLLDLRATGDCGATALARKFVRLCEWWRGIAKAPLGCTAGQLATGVLRSHLPARSLVVHDDADTHRLERQCAHGGRASVWYYGRIGGLQRDNVPRHEAPGDSALRQIPGQVHSLDVSSMYPTLLRDESYPIALQHVLENVRPSALIDMARTGGVVARVRIRANAPEYPQRTDKGTIYPVGVFTTVLAAPELVMLADTPGDGEILDAYHVAAYRQGRPFRGAMDALINARANATGDAERTFAKLLANSVAGRLAMRIGAWKRWPALDEPGRWGEEWVGSAGGGSACRYRWVLGLCYCYDPEREPKGPHTAAFAHLTSYGRVRMRKLREACPLKSVYAQHTDGLYCSADALRSLSDGGMLEDSGPGSLRVVGSADSAQFWGPSHYRFGESWTLAGYSDAWVDEARREVHVTLKPSLFGARNPAAPDAVRTMRRAVSLPTTTDGQTIGPDGWALPARVHKSQRTKE